MPIRITSMTLCVKEIPYAFNLVDGTELRTDQDFVEAHLFDTLNALACLLRGADEIHGGQFRQLGRFGTLLEVDRAIGEHGIAAALITIDFHTVFEVFEAAKAPGRCPSLRLLGGVGDPSRAAPGAYEDWRASFASRPRC